MHSKVVAEEKIKAHMEDSGHVPYEVLEISDTNGLKFLCARSPSFDWAVSGRMASIGYC